MNLLDAISALMEFLTNKKTALIHYLPTLPAWQAIFFIQEG